MELKERHGKYGIILYYEDIEPELLEFKEGIRVLPAPFYYDKKVRFTFKCKHEPGTKSWPNGGYELRGPSNEFRAYDLDQIIIHPEIFETKKRQEKIKKRQEREKVVRDKKLKKIERENALSKGIKVSSGRGRPKLSEEEKLKRKVERELNPLPDGEKRKGRKPLTSEERIKREAEKLARKILNGGKRGRPSNPERKLQREQERLKSIEINPERKRGRPKRK